MAGSGSYRLIPFPPERKAIDIGDVYSSYAKIQATLGWEPRIPLAEGLARMVEFYRANWQQYWT